MPTATHSASMCSPGSLEDHCDYHSSQTNQVCSTCTGQAAASPSAQMVWPSICFVISHSLAPGTKAACQQRHASHHLPYNSRGQCTQEGLRPDAWELLRADMRQSGAADESEQAQTHISISSSRASPLRMRVMISYSLQQMKVTKSASQASHCKCTLSWVQQQLRQALKNKWQQARTHQPLPSRHGVHCPQDSCL